MSTVSIDHIAMPTARRGEADRVLQAARVLRSTTRMQWRSGEVNAFSIQVGDSKINVHPEGYTASLRGPTAVPGCGDICFVWDGTAAECEEMLEKAGVEIISGPGPRRGALRHRNAVSLYARDPDENLLEWMIYQ